MAPYPVALAVRGVSHRYGELRVLEGVECSFPAGQASAIIGPNGAGKSTLLKVVLGLLTPETGSVSVLGRRFAEVRDRVAFIPQRASVEWDFPITVLDVVLMGLIHETGFLPRVRPDLRARAMEALGALGMADFAGRQIGKLSGGQQQRVFLARALVQGAELFLLDEPFAGVDAATETIIARLFRDLTAAGKTVIAVHHDLASVPAMFDHAVLLNRRVIADGPVASAMTTELLARTYGVPLMATGTSP